MTQLLEDVPVPKIIRIIRSPLGRIMVGLPEKRGRLESILRSIGHGPSLDQGRIPDGYLDWHLALSNQTGAMCSERGCSPACFRPANSTSWTAGTCPGSTDPKRVAGVLAAHFRANPA